ncbi:MAG: hypothetical protein D6790_06610 [Caldilineae bacterium]|nr:MAG: hypothetical protein D6790_06610 [Caldilineae bacterium]
MTASPTPQEILDEIEFELLQSAIRHDELGAAIQQVLTYHAETRAALLAEDSNPSLRQVIAHQAKVNDMVLNLLGEMANELRYFHRQQREMREWLREKVNRPPEEEQEMLLSLPPLKQEEIAVAETNRRDRAALPAPLGGEPSLHLAEVEAMMKPEALRTELYVRGLRIPLLGGLLFRLRMALHQLPFFYTDRLAKKQTAVNQTYGRALMDLMEANREMRREIATLRSLLAQKDA